MAAWSTVSETGKHFHIKTDSLCSLVMSVPYMPQECYDLVALLLMIRMNYHHQLIMNKRRIPCLDDYLDRVNILLWPRFKV